MGINVFLHEEVSLITLTDSSGYILHIAYKHFAHNGDNMLPYAAGSSRTLRQW